MYSVKRNDIKYSLKKSKLVASLKNGKGCACPTLATTNFIKILIARTGEKNSLKKESLRFFTSHHGCMYINIAWMYNKN